MKIEKLGEPPLSLPKTPLGSATRAGVQFENKVIRRLVFDGYDVEHNPWYRIDWDTFRSASYCCPDALIYRPDWGIVIVAEIKLTYTPDALSQLWEKYIPAVRATVNHSFAPRPLIIVRNLVHGLPVPLSLRAALDSALPLIQWRGVGPVFPKESVNCQRSSTPTTIPTAANG